MHALLNSLTLSQGAMAFGPVFLGIMLHSSAFAQAPSPPATPPMPRLSHRVIPAITAEDVTAQFPVNAQGAHEMEIPQIVNTSADRDVRAILSGKQVETVGEIIPQPDAALPDVRIRIGRPQMQCCAAHACSYSIIAAFSDHKPELKEGCWVRLTGVLRYENEGEKFLAVISVKSIVEIPAPASSLLK